MTSKAKRVILITVLLFGSLSLYGVGWLGWPAGTYRSDR
jgi:hypothetical protein